MSSASFDDRKRQEDEVQAMSSIYDRHEFYYKVDEKSERIRCFTNIFPTISAESLQVKYLDYNANSRDTSSINRFMIKHLPPVKLYIQLPSNYPSVAEPYLDVTISWLPPWEISFVCQKLDEIWMENKGNEILYLWLEFLRNDLMSFLNIKGSLDISFMHMVYVRPRKYLLSDLPLLADSRASNRALLLDPKQFLMNYSEDQHRVEFEIKLHNCYICFEQYKGSQCIELRNCSHVYCKECMQQYVATKINDRDIKNIICPMEKCPHEIDINEIKFLCPDLFSKYDELLFKVTLNTMKDIIFCPRKLCQYPVTKESDESLAICANCYYSFCVYCLKGYHGDMPCAFSIEEEMKLINDYKNGNNHKKKELEQKYGRRHIQRTVEKYLSEEYLERNSKPCPACRTLISKINGCNKMVCIHCQAAFCWLCGVHIVERNVYQHYKTSATCSGRLFEGLVSPEMAVPNRVIAWFGINNNPDYGDQW